jgi:hypothetical protein
VCTKAEFTFINVLFGPTGKKTDKGDYEGSLPGDEPNLTALPNGVAVIRCVTLPTGLHIMILARLACSGPELSKSLQAIATNYLLVNTKIAMQLPGKVKEPQPPTIRIPKRQPPLTTALCTEGQGKGPVKGIAKREEEAGEDSTSDEGEDVENVKGVVAGRSFCQSIYCKAVIKMMEWHYCVHSMIPGYAPSLNPGIKCWAVQQMYNFCETHDLQELWAYLWENWYQKGRWELWACSAHNEIPMLKTTMILESQ